MGGGGLKELFPSSSLLLSEPIDYGSAGSSSNKANGSVIPSSL